LQEIRSSEAKLKLLNVWATWCGPCIEEFPILLQLRQEYQGQGFELIFVSTDMLEELDKVEYFLKEQGLDFVSYIKEESDENFIRAMNTNWSGALPASFLYNQSGELVDFWTGDLTYEEFESKIKAFLN
jgi:thiol-disulfide isomerase/thioredoxin